MKIELHSFLKKFKDSIAYLTKKITKLDKCIINWKK